MASPQVEKGYTRIANELLQAIALFRFTGNERSVLDIIMRLTWGYQKKKAKISYGTLSKFTNIPRRTVIRIIEVLVASHVVGLTRTTEGRGINELWINKDYAMWKSVRNDTRFGVTQATRTGVSPATTYKEINKEINIKKVDDLKILMMKRTNMNELIRGSD